MSPTRPAQRTRGKTPASLAEAQLAFERQSTDAQKLEFVFRYMLRLIDERKERESADVYVARALDSIQRDVRTVEAKVSPSLPGEPPTLFDQVTAALARSEALEQRMACMLGQVELLATAVQDQLLNSDSYSVQAVNALITLTDQVRAMRRDLAPIERAVGEPAPIIRFRPAAATG